MELDEEAKGFIRKKDLLDLMKSLGEPLDEEELSQFISVLPHKPGDSDYIIAKELANILLPELEVKNEMAKN